MLTCCRNISHRSIHIDKEDKHDEINIEALSHVSAKLLATESQPAQVTSHDHREVRCSKIQFEGQERAKNSWYKKFQFDQSLILREN